MVMLKFLRCHELSSKGQPTPHVVRDCMVSNERGINSDLPLREVLILFLGRCTQQRFTYGSYDLRVGRQMVASSSWLTTWRKPTPNKRKNAIMKQPASTLAGLRNLHLVKKQQHTTLSPSMCMLTFGCRLTALTYASCLFSTTVLAREHLSWRDTFQVDCRTCSRRELPSHFWLSQVICVDVITCVVNTCVDTII